MTVPQRDHHPSDAVGRGATGGARALGCRLAPEDMTALHTAHAPLAFSHRATRMEELIVPSMTAWAAAGKEQFVCGGHVGKTSARRARSTRKTLQPGQGHWLTALALGHRYGQWCSRQRP